MMYDLGVGSKRSRFGRGCYRSADRRVTHLLHMRQVIQSRNMGARRGKLTGSFAGWSSLPVSESGRFRCNDCLDHPFPWYKCCPGESTIVRFFPPSGPHHFTRYLQVECPSSVA